MIGMGIRAFFLGSSRNDESEFWRRACEARLAGEAQAASREAAPSSQEKEDGRRLSEI